MRALLAGLGSGFVVGFAFGLMSLGDPVDEEKALAAGMGVALAPAERAHRVHAANQHSNGRIPVQLVGELNADSD